MVAGATSSKTLKEIAALVGGEVVGDERLAVRGISGIREAREGDLTFLANAHYARLLETTGASAVIVSREVTRAIKPIIRTDNPSLAFAQAAELLAPLATHHPHGVHPSAVVSPRAQLGRGVAVGPLAVVEDEAVIADGAILYAHVYVGHGARVGAGSVLYPQVVLRDGVRVGARAIIHSGTVIGSDGFGFETVQGVHRKILQLGDVVIEDDVEIGANCTIDRARFGTTRIGRGTKLDNLVHVAHNVTVGEHSLLVAQVGISGSVTLGHHVTLAGQVGVAGHVEIGDHVVVGAQAGVIKSLPGGAAYWGMPARPMDEAKQVYALMQRLPHMKARVDALVQRLERLEQRHGTAATNDRA